MFQFVMLYTLMVVSNGLMANADEELVPAPAGETPPCAKDQDTYCEQIDNYPDWNDSWHAWGRAKSEDKPLCQARQYKVIPRAARTKDNEWRYIVNVPDYRQMREEEVCSNWGESCSSYLQSSYKGECQQEHRLTNMLALHPSGDKLYFVNVIYNSCCQCNLIFD